MSAGLDAYRFTQSFAVILTAILMPTSTSTSAATKTPRERILRKEAVVHATLDEVWNCWTTTEGIASFFAPESKIELRLGGPYELYMGATEPDQFGKRGTQGCKVLSFIPREMLAFEWNFPPKVPALRASGAKTQVVLRFMALGDGRVRVKFAQLGWKEGADWDAGYEYFDRAWSSVMEMLEKRFKEKRPTDAASVDVERASSRMNIDGHVNIQLFDAPDKRQAFEMEIPAPVSEVWNLLATEQGYKKLGAKEPKVELRPGGAYSFWPGAPNKVLACVPYEVLSTSGSAPEQFPNVRKGGTWSSYFLESLGKGRTRLRLVCVGWRPGEKEWDDAFDYFVKANPQFLNAVYATLTKRQTASRGVNHQGTEGDVAGDVLRHEAIVDAPVEDVWKAFTTKEGIESWMVPKADIDLRVGGKMRTHYDPKGQLGDENSIENTILSYEPLRMLSIKATKAPANFPHKEAIKGMWSVIRFEPMEDGRTRVICTGLGYGDDPASQELRGHFEKGNAWTLKKLQERFPPPERKEAQGKTDAPAEASPDATAAPLHGVEFESYLAHIAAAEASLVLNETAGVRRWLSGAPRTHLGWEWRYLDASVDQSIRTWADERDAVISIAWSPDGRVLAEALGNGDTVLREVESGKALRTIPGKGKALWHVTFSGDGRRLATSGADGVVRIHDADTGNELRAIPHEKTQVYSAAFSPDGRNIAASMLGFVKVWDAESGAELRTLKGHVDRPPVTRVVYSPDGAKLASASWDNHVIVWNAASGEIAHKLGPGYGGDEYTPFNAVLFSPDGRRIAACSGSGTCWVWDAATGDVVRKWQAHEKSVYGLAWSADGKRLATGAVDQGVCFWDADSGALLRTMRGHTAAVRSVAFDPEGKVLASTGADQRVKFWCVGGAAAQHVRCELGVWGAQFSPDGKYLATASSDRTVRVWDVTSGEAVVTFGDLPEQATAVAFSPDGKRLAATTNKPAVHIFDIEKKKPLRELEGHAVGSPDVAWSTDGRYLVSASYDKTIRVWDPETGETIHTLSAGDFYAYAVDVSPDSKTLASADRDGRIRLWDLSTGKQCGELVGLKSSPLGVAWSPDGRWIAASGYDQDIVVWDARSRSEISRLKGHDREVYGLAFSPDSSRLASAGYDQTVRLWDFRRGVQTATLVRARQGAYAVAFSPNGERLAASFTDGEVRILDTVSPARRLGSHAVRLSRAN